jgi:methylated-DNA-[protein]-cysteine S-methyltransferase
MICVMKKTYYTIFDTKLCPMIIVGDAEGITHLHYVRNAKKKDAFISPLWVENTGFFTDAIQQITEYLSGARTIFDLVLHPGGTEFQKNVWKALQEIPYGQTRSYQDIARAIGNEKAQRAVGLANNKNPIPLIIPCHRVVRKNGDIGGYGSGVDIKRALLAIEGVV